MRFLFDFLSPYAYLAWTQVHDLAARHGRDVEPVPVLFAGLLSHWGQKGPAEIGPKRIYVFKDALRSAHRLGVPLSPPPTHPFNPLLALRVSSLPMPSETRRRLVDGLFAATWVRGEGVTEPAVITRIAAEAGVPGDAVARAGEPECKARLRAQTEAAIASDTFGVPTVLVDGELFWGLDSLVHLDAFLRGEDPVPQDLVKRWAHVVPSAVR